MLKYIYDLYVQLQNINRYLDPGRILHILNYEYAIICVYINICIYIYIYEVFTNTCHR